MTSKRRIVIGQYPNGDIKRISDETAQDIITDKARPGYKSIKIWATLGSPANFGNSAKEESDSYPHTLIPPKSGSMCRFVTIPPENEYIYKVTREDVKNFYKSINSIELFSARNLKHPYMHKKNSLDYIYVMKGSIVLILDEDQVQLNQGDTIVNLGGNHAWSNRTDSVCELFISSHSGY